MFDPTKPVQTRDGRRARIVCDNVNAPQAIVAVVDTIDTIDTTLEMVRIYYPDGRTYTTQENKYDLINIPVKSSITAPLYYEVKTNSLSNTEFPNSVRVQLRYTFTGNSLTNVEII